MHRHGFVDTCLLGHGLISPYFLKVNACLGFVEFYIQPAFLSLRFDYVRSS